MKAAKEIPLVSGLIGGKARSIHGQLEIYLIDYDTVRIVIRRKAYSGLSDIEFSVAETDLQDITDLLNEARQKADTYWLSRIAAMEAEAES